MEKSRMSRPWTIGIIGGGPGGLMTAYSLQRLANHPINITLFEAENRLGGKVLTPQFAARPVRYEAGAAEFYDYSVHDDDPLRLLIAELGLPTRPMGGPAVIMNQRVLANLDDIRDQLGPQAHDAILHFDRIAKDRMTPREFFCADEPHLAPATPDPTGFDTLLEEIADPQARCYIQNMIHSDLAAEPCHTNLGYGLQNYLMNDPAYMHVYGIDGGNERLTQELATRTAADIRLHHRVRQIGRGERGLRVVSDRGGQTSVDEFDFVVVSLPLNQLLSVEYTGDPLATAMRDHHHHHDHPAHYLRITMLFERAFWRQAFSDSYWMLDRFGGCCLYDESSRDPESAYGVLGWLLGGNAASEMSSLADEDLIAAALDSLPEFLAHGRSLFIEGKVHRWVGAVSAMPGGIVPRSLDRRHQPEPIRHPNLLVVGDYLFDSTINGVLDSAEYVAEWIASHLTDRGAPHT